MDLHGFCGCYCRVFVLYVEKMGLCNCRTGFFLFLGMDLHDFLVYAIVAFFVLYVEKMCIRNYMLSCFHIIELFC